MKHFKHIFHGAFQLENLTKLGQGMADKAAAEASKEAKGMANMLLCLGIYGQIILHFSAVSLLGPLQQSLSQYRVRLIEMSVIYKSDSVRAYNATLMRTRIPLGQGDATAWAPLEDRRCCDLLVRKTSRIEATKPSSNVASKSLSPSQNIRSNF